MKRFKINNKANGLNFQVEGNALEETYNVWPEQWGLPERWVHEDQCSKDDKLTSLETRPIEMSDKVEHRLPAQYEIVEEDMTAEIEQQIAKKERLQALKDKHKAMKNSDLDTIVELRQAVLELQEILGLK